MLVLITFPGTDIGINMDCIEKSDIARFFPGNRAMIRPPRKKSIFVRTMGMYEKDKRFISIEHQ